MKVDFIFHEKILTDSALLVVITGNYKKSFCSLARVSQPFVGVQLHQQPPLPGTSHSQLLLCDRSGPAIVRAHLVTALNPQQLCTNTSRSSKAEVTWRGDGQVHAQRGRRLTSFHLGLLSSALNLDIQQQCRKKYLFTSQLQQPFRRNVNMLSSRQQMKLKDRRFKAATNMIFALYFSSML